MLPSPPRLIDFTGYHVPWRIQFDQIIGKVLVFEKYGMRCDWLLQYKGESVMEHGILWSQSDWLNRILNLAESSDNQKWKNYFPRDDDSFLNNFVMYIITK